ncbi:hypothetical protein EV361DRAFT_941153 [Lentinula raphanica]|nr:hypothetical protein EV361DRAFT_941153 [Lentinula raphanica]
MDEELVDFGDLEYEDDALPPPDVSSSQQTDHSNTGDGAGGDSQPSSSLSSHPSVGNGSSVGLVPPTLDSLNNMSLWLIEASRTIREQLPNNTFTNLASGPSSIHHSLPQPAVPASTTAPAVTTPVTAQPAPSSAPTRRPRKPSSAPSSTASPAAQYMPDTCLEPSPAGKESASVKTARVESNTVRLEQLIHRCSQELENRINENLPTQIQSAVLDAKTETLRSVLVELRKMEARTREQNKSLKSEIMDLLRTAVKESQDELWEKTVDLFPVQALQELLNSVSTFNNVAMSSPHPPPLTSSLAHPPPTRSPSAPSDQPRSPSVTSSRSRSSSRDSPHPDSDSVVYPRSLSLDEDSARPRSPHTPPRASLAHRMGVNLNSSGRKRRRDPHEGPPSKKTRLHEPSSSLSFQSPAPVDSPSHTLWISRSPHGQPFSSTIDRAFDMYREWASAIARRTDDRAHLPRPYYIDRPHPLRLRLYFTAPADETFYSMWMDHRPHIPCLQRFNLARGGTA